MADGRKYAGLPDLDAAPDIYETPDLIEDNSTNRASSALRSDSAASSYYEPEPDDGTGEIDRGRLDPDEARMHFLPSHADARDSGLATRISSKRRQYRATAKTGPETLDSSDPRSLSDYDDESLERKVTRLRREILEVKEIFEKKKSSKKGDSAELSLERDGSWDALNDILDDVHKAPIYSAASKIVHTINPTPRLVHGSKGDQKVEPTEQNLELPSYTVTYAPTYQQSHALAKAADFDARLSLVETLLGVETIHLPTQDRPSYAAILPTLDNLERQISTLSSSTNSSLDLIDRKVKQLTQDTQKLTEARTSARTAQDALNLSLELAVVDTKHIRDAEEMSEKNAKINALYGTLPTIDSLAPLLPSVLDRLKSLQSVHAGAASAGQNLLKLEAQQQSMGEEIKSWREGLEKVEKVVEQGEQTMMGNAKVVEAWVKELEDRMRKLGA